MKTVIHIETVDELLQAINPHRQKGDISPYINMVHLTIDEGQFELSTKGNNSKNSEFDVSRVPVFEFLAAVLQKQNVLLTLNQSTPL